jgi:hypothetical protein
MMDRLLDKIPLSRDQRFLGQLARTIASSPWYPPTRRSRFRRAAGKPPASGGLRKFPAQLATTGQ